MTIILRQLRQLHVASLATSKEVIFIILTFAIIFCGGITLPTLSATEKLQVVPRVAWKHPITTILYTFILHCRLRVSGQ